MYAASKRTGRPHHRTSVEPAHERSQSLHWPPPPGSLKARPVLERSARALRGLAAERDGARRGAPCGWGSRS
jgi:hypothetical protein